MQDTLVSEPEGSTTESQSSTTDFATTGAGDSPTEAATTLDTASPFRFLQTGAPALDQELRDQGIENGGVVHLDCAPGQSSLGFLLALCRAALDRGERAVFLFVPPAANLKSGKNTGPLVRNGQKLDPHLARQLAHFGLSLNEENLNEENLRDPRAAFGYLVANTPDEFEQRLNDLLPDTTSPDTTSPDLIVVYGLERLFSHLPLDFDSPAGWDDEVELLLEATTRLRRWVNTYSARGRHRGSTLYLGRSADSYTRPDETLFARGLRPLLDAVCPTTFYAEKTLSHCFCGECGFAVRGRLGIPVSLYERGVLFTRALVYVAETQKKASGPFLDEAGMEATEGNPRRISHRYGFH